MAIVNRTKDPSEQRFCLTQNYGAVGTAATIQLALVPFASVLEGIRVAAAGLSSALTMDLTILRFIVGTGVTAIAGGATTVTVREFGTSGFVSMSLAASGNTLLNLLAGDELLFTTATADSAVTNLSTAIVIKAVQDIKTTFGI